MNGREGGEWRNTESCPDPTAPNPSVKMRISMTHHDDEAWRTTVCCTDTTSPNARVKLSTSITLHDDDPWRTTVCCTESTVPSTRTKLDENGRNRARLEGGMEISMDASTGLMCYWLIYFHALITSSNARTNLKQMKGLIMDTNTLLIRNAQHHLLYMSLTEFWLQLPYCWCWWQNADRHTRLRGLNLF